MAEREEQIRGYAEIMQARKDRIDNDCWSALEPYFDHFCPEDPNIRRDWLSSIKRFVSELGVYEVEEAAEIAVSKCPHSERQAFKYLCGICWKKIKGDQ